MPQSMGLQRGRHYLATEQQFPTPQSPRTWWTKLEEKAAVESEGEGGRGLQSWLAPRPQADIRETRLGRQDGQVGTITPPFPCQWGLLTGEEGGQPMAHRPGVPPYVFPNARARLC